MTTPLSANFTLEQLTFSQTAVRKGIDNTPNDTQVANLTRLCTELLEPAMTFLGTSFHIDSGFRSEALNAAVGGSPTSEHRLGLAADCIPQGVALETAFNTLRKSNLPFDQIIFECKSWIHLGMCEEGKTPRHQALTATGSPGAWHYQPVTD